MGYTKLHATIIHSSIWSEAPSTRLVWITMLAMANQDGIVEASVRGLARAANVSDDECQSALAVLLGPDPDSRDGTTGERIEKVPGGWLILNHANYRDVRTRQQILTAARVRRHRARHKGSDTGNDVAIGSGVKRGAASASEDADASVPSEVPVPTKTSSTPKGTTPPKPDDVEEQVWKDWLSLRRAKKAPPSQTAVNRLRSEADRAGLSLSAVMEICVQNGWQGFQAGWMDRPGVKGRELTLQEKLKNPRKHMQYEGDVVQDF